MQNEHRYLAASPGMKDKLTSTHIYSILWVTAFLWVMWFVSPDSELLFAAVSLIVITLQCLLQARFTSSSLFLSAPLKHTYTAEEEEEEGGVVLFPQFYISCHFNAPSFLVRNLQYAADLNDTNKEPCCSFY